MSKNILIINGHPDPRPQRFVHALADSYRAGAEGAGHEVRTLAIGDLEFPMLRTTEDFDGGEPPAAIARSQQLIARADHLVILFPLWLGAMPALLKGFFEQVLRPGFAFAPRRRGLPGKLLAGKTARIVVTMGMPGFFYRWFYRSHSLKSLERNILSFCGIRPVGSDVVGMVAGGNPRRRNAWLDRMRDLGSRAR